MTRENWNLVSIVLIVFAVATLKVSARNDLPLYVVSIHYKDEHLCTGILLTPKHVLSSAGCLSKKYLKGYSDELMVYFGTDLKQPVEILKTTLVDYHPGFMDLYPEDSHRDIAIIKLATRARIKSRDLILPGVVAEIEYPCRVYVWKNKKLSLVDRIMADRNHCKSSQVADKSAEKKLCSFWPQYEVRQKDRGTPLICGDKIMGIFSWIYPHEKIHRYVYTDIVDQSEYLHYALEYL